jgi:hypothetical protein
MSKDRRYTIVKNLITAGYIKTFREVFETLPKSIMARDLGMNNTRFTNLMNNVDGFFLRDIIRMAVLLEISETTMYELIWQQYTIDKKSKKKKV